MSRTYTKSKSAYFAELLIIIAGITISFIVNEWRETNKLKDKKENLLIDINKDLFADSMVLERTIKYYELMANSHDSLLKYRTDSLQADSLTKYLDHLISYYPFNETANTYKRINTDSDMTIERNDSLIWYYMNLHNVVYPAMREMFYVEKDFVLNTALPYMDKNAPFVYPSPVNRSFDGSVYYELRKKDEFMNYLKSGRVYKRSMIRAHLQGFNYLKFIKSSVREQIEERKSKD